MSISKATPGDSRRLVTRPRLAALLVSGALLGGFGLALVRGENVSDRLPSKAEWLFQAEIETDPYPRTVSSFADRRFGRPPALPGIVAVMTVDAIYG